MINESAALLLRVRCIALAPIVYHRLLQSTCMIMKDQSVRRMDRYSA
jgi:hypothetical protein